MIMKIFSQANKHLEFLHPQERKDLFPSQIGNMITVTFVWAYDLFYRASNKSISRNILRTILPINWQETSRNISNKSRLQTRYYKCNKK